MNIIIRGSKITITEAMQNYIEEKISKLEKYLDKPDEIKANVVVMVNKRLHKIEVTIPLKNFILRAEEEEEDFYAAVDIVTDKLERQIRKNKTKLSAIKTKEITDFIYEDIEDLDEEPQHIVKRKKIEVKPMSEEEAIIQMELLGHQFYLYKDDETNKSALVYKRKDGNYGIIEAE